MDGHPDQQPSSRQTNTVERQRLTRNLRIGLLILLAALVVGALYWLREVILPFAVAAFLAYLLAPAIGRLTQAKVGKRQISRGMAILIVYFLVLGLFTLMGAYIVPKLTSEANGLVRDLPRILKKIEHDWIVPFEDRVNKWLAELSPTPEYPDPKSLPPPEPMPFSSDPAEPLDPLRPQLGEMTKGDFGVDLLDEGDEADPNEKAKDTSAKISESELERLARNYTFLVEATEDGGYRVSPELRTDKTAEITPKSWQFSRQISTTFRQFRSRFEENIVEMLRVSQRYLVAVVSSFFMTFLVLMVSAFLLVDPLRLINFVKSIVPTDHQDNFDDLIFRLDRGLSGVVRGQMMICVVNGTATGIGIAILGVPFVFTLTLIATVFSLIPIFGVLISTIPILLMGITVSVTTALLALGWILVIHFIEGNFLNPKILGDSSRIHPALIVFALVAGEYMAGIMGALLAVPVMSLVQNSFLFLKSAVDEMEAGS